MKRFLVAAIAALGVGISAPAFAAVGVAAEGGVEGYTGGLSDSLRAGPSWGVTADLQPSAPVGLELRYQGASNQLYGSGNIFNGPRAARVVNNGGEALAKISMARNNNAIFEPFVAGGIGLTRYTLSNSVNGFSDDNVGEVPVSAGVALHPGGNSGKLTLGLRGDYNFLFDNQFAKNAGTVDYGLFSKSGGDNYRGLLTLGGNF